MVDAGRGYPDRTVGVRIPLGIESVLPVFPAGLVLALVPVFDQTPGDELLGYDNPLGSGYYFGDSD